MRKPLDCGSYVRWGFVAGLTAWLIFVATLIYAALYVPDIASTPNQLFTQRRGVQAGGFIAGWWLALAGLALAGIGYIREFKSYPCLFGLMPAALYVANPWSVLVFVQFVGG